MRYHKFDAPHACDIPSLQHRHFAVLCSMHHFQRKNPISDIVRGILQHGWPAALQTLSVLALICQATGRCGDAQEQQFAARAVVLSIEQHDLVLRAASRSALKMLRTDVRPDPAGRGWLRLPALIAVLMGVLGSDRGSMRDCIVTNTCVDIAARTLSCGPIRS